MKVAQSVYRLHQGWSPELLPEPQAGLVLVFGTRDLLQTSDALARLAESYPRAVITGCSTAGEIAGPGTPENEDCVLDDTLVASILTFRNTTVHGASVPVPSPDHSALAGRQLAEALPAPGLKHVLVLSDGLQVNASQLVQGLTQALPPGVTVTGGLSADGSHFSETLVLYGARAASRSVAVVGLYGDAIHSTCGSRGGWDAFGPERRITRARGNVLFELDGQPALALYKKYLGAHARDLPASGLLFPLAIRAGGQESVVVRTILAVSERDGSLTFAGDLPEGYYARLMKANFDRLVDGATGAAAVSRPLDRDAEFALLISCVGRKLLLKQRVEEEIEGVREVLGPRTCLAGFYSYGEISPFARGTRCELHNQTMTITTLSEAA